MSNFRTCWFKSSPGHSLRLEPFTPLYAPTVATWVNTDEELRWLAPSTPPPLTAAKVAGWLRPGRRAFVLIQEGDETPVGYAELNPMRRDPNHLWIGHVIIRPDRRGRRLGQSFVQRLVANAFADEAVTRISLIVFPDNTAAVECYRRVGFSFAGEEYHRFGESEPLERMVRLEIRPTLSRPSP